MDRGLSESSGDGTLALPGAEAGQDDHLGWAVRRAEAQVRLQHVVRVAHRTIFQGVRGSRTPCLRNRGEIRNLEDVGRLVTRVQAGVEPDPQPGEPDTYEQTEQDPGDDVE